MSHFKPRVVLIEDDCLVAMKAIPDKSVNLILCDLPYGTTRNAWDSVIPFEPMWEQYKRILAPKGVVVLTGAGLFTGHLMMSNPKWFQYRLVWHKSKATNFLNAKKQPLRKFEDVCIFYPAQPTYNPQMGEGKPYSRDMFTLSTDERVIAKNINRQKTTPSYGKFKRRALINTGDRYPTDVISFATADADLGTAYHPTQKPIELGRYLIRTYTNQGDVVLDNSCGSASFLVAAVTERRHAIGIELNQGVISAIKGSLDLIGVAQERLSTFANISIKTCRAPAHSAKKAVGWLLSKKEKELKDVD
jgi:site-specific DNA-methyltransferase (adenine-specific)